MTALSGSRFVRNSANCFGETSLSPLGIAASRSEAQFDGGFLLARHTKQGRDEIGILLARQGKRPGRCHRIGQDRDIALKQCLRQRRQPARGDCLQSRTRHRSQDDLTYRCRRRGIAQPLGQHLLHRGSAGKASELARQFFALGVGQRLRGKTLAEEAGQRVTPLGMPADDPRGRLLHQWLRGVEFARDRIDLEVRSRLVERDESGSPGQGRCRL